MKEFGDVLVVTPGEAADFGTYQCNITNGVSSILCRVSLLEGLDKPGKSNTRGRKCMKWVRVTVLLASSLLRCKQGMCR